MSPAETVESDALRPDSLKLRHRPVQQRGQVRFDEILRAARELLVEKGIEGFLVEDVADRAGIPVGSVYQFFPNKLAIVAELAELDTVALINLLTETPVAVALDDWKEVIDSIVDHAVRKWVEEPSRSAVWLAMKSTDSGRPT
jgi:AcrR family transcriptional regulator